MKKCLTVMMLALLLTGCSEPKTFETMSDVYYEPETPVAAQISLTLPEEAAVSVMNNPLTGSIYLCDGYSVTVQTVSAGDLDATLRDATGFPRENLLVMEREDGTNRRYECVWAAAGEGEDQVGRAVILDDGSYHYVLTVMAGADRAGDLAETWQQIIGSFSTVP